MRMTGSLQNRLMENQDPSKLAPKIGDGVTMTSYTDRYPGTIIKITATQIHVQEDTAVRTDSNGMSESQTYEYTPNPNGTIRIFRKTKHGYRSNSYGLVVGHRNKYHDFSF